MTQITPIELEDGIIIYMEVQDDVQIVSPLNPTRELTREDLGRGDKGLNEVRFPQEQIARNFKLIESTIKAYTTYTLNAFKQVAIADINKVTLEFGIKVAGKAGIPCVTEGSAESHLKITVECSFPQKAIERSRDET